MSTNKSGYMAANELRAQSPKKFSNVKSKVGGNLKSQKLAVERRKEVARNSAFDESILQSMARGDSPVGTSAKHNFVGSRLCPDDVEFSSKMSPQQQAMGELDVEAEIRKRLAIIQEREGEIHKLQDQLEQKSLADQQQSSGNKQHQSSQSTLQSKPVMDLQGELDQEHHDINQYMNAQIERPRQYTVHNEQQPSQPQISTSSKASAKKTTVYDQVLQQRKPTALASPVKKQKKAVSPTKTLNQSSMQQFQNFTRQSTTVPSHIVKSAKPRKTDSPVKHNFSATQTKLTNYELPVQKPAPVVRRAASPLKSATAARKSPKKALYKEVMAPVQTFADSSDVNTDAHVNKSLNDTQMKTVPQLRSLQSSFSATKLGCTDLASLETEFNRIMVERGQTTYISKSPTKQDQERQEFYKMMGEVYDPKSVKRHISPTKRLIQQKNSTTSHKQLLGARANYDLHYTTAPGKSYVVEPTGGSLPYDLAYKNPNKFYKVVMNQEVKTHKVVDAKQNGKGVHHLVSKVSQRKIGRIMRSIQEKLMDQLRGNGNWSEEDLQGAMQDEHVQEAVQKMVKQQSIEFVDPNNNVPILKKEMQLIGSEGERAIQQSPDLIEASKKGDEIEKNLACADLRIKDAAFDEVKTEINDFIRRNTKK